MNYTNFKNTVQSWPLVFSRDLTRNKANKQALRNQLKRWHSKRLLIKLKKGIFLLNESDRKITPAKGYIANQLYTPSYLSLEYALNYYGLIPERVSDITSVTTRKTKRLKNEIGQFIYQHIKPACFKGFYAVKDESNLSFFIAEPEKALVDFCYLNLKNFQDNYESVFEQSYRLQNTESLNVKKILYYAKLFKNIKLSRVCKALCNFIRKERQ